MVAQEQEPLITIGITAWREGAQLRDCWESVLAQTDARWAAVIVLDGGHDAATRAVFDTLRHPRLRKVVLPENRGPYPARNIAFSLTETTLHFYLDADDLLLPESVALVLAAHARAPDAAIIVGDYEYFDGGSGVKRYPARVGPEDYLGGQPLPGPCAYRTALWTQLGGFADELARGNGDYDFHIGAAELGVPVAHCGAIFYRYRLGQSTKVSLSYDCEYHKTHEIMVARHPQFFAAHPRRRRRFLAVAYLRAAVSNFVVGDHVRGRGLLAIAKQNGLLHDMWLWQPALTAIRRSLFPSGIAHGLRALWRHAPGRRVLQETERLAVHGLPRTRAQRR